MLTDSRSREEMRAFLQKRLAAFGLMLAAVFGMFFVWRVIGALTGDDSPSQAFLPWQGLAVAAFAATWVLCRGGARSTRVPAGDGGGRAPHRRRLRGDDVHADVVCGAARHHLACSA